jgi:hypothetical protein
MVKRLSNISNDKIKYYQLLGCHLNILSSCSWSHGSLINAYLYNQCLWPLTLWVRIPLRRGVLDTTFCGKVCQWLAGCRWFSPGTPVSPTNKTDHHDIAEILLKVVWNTITPLWFAEDIICKVIVNLQVKHQCYMS